MRKYPDNYRRIGDEFNGFHKPMRRVDRVFLHCSAASRQSVTAAEVDRWHVQRGFREIGYHFFIRSSGLIEHGRDLEVSPAAQAGHNQGTIAICVNGLHQEDFTKAALENLVVLCDKIWAAYHGNITFHGHCEVSPKTCPVFDYKALLGLDDQGRMSALAGF